MNLKKKLLFSFPIEDCLINTEKKLKKLFFLKENFQYIKPRHSFHLVDPSPWPLVVSLGAFMLTTGGVLYMHKFIGGDRLLLTGLSVIILYSMYTWWRDVIREAAFEDQNSLAVRKGLRLGMVLFIVLEIMFFFAFLWIFFYPSLVPVFSIGGVWPSEAISPIKTLGIPLTNTFFLLSFGATVTWSYYSIIVRAKRQAIVVLIFTLILAILFTGLQVLEYTEAPFNISDSVFGSGFHGFHHFVDIVWLFLFVCVFGCRCLFSILKQPSTIKQKIANNYIIFIVSILNHRMIPLRFITFTLILGSYLGRKIIWIWSVSYPHSLSVIFLCPLLTYIVSFILLFGTFILGVEYPSVFGKVLIKFLTENASKEILNLIGLEKKSTVTKKKTKKSQGRRNYSTTRVVSLDVYESMALLKTVGFTQEDIRRIQELGKVLDNVKGISSEDCYKILDKCAANPDLCSFYIQELAKSPDKRDLALHAVAKMQGFFNMKFELNSDKIAKRSNSMGSLRDTIESKSFLSDLADMSKFEVESGFSTSVDTKVLVSEGKASIAKSSKTVAKVALPIIFTAAAATALGNSKTLEASFNRAGNNLCSIEELGSYDSNDKSTVSLPLPKLKKNHTT